MNTIMTSDFIKWLCVSGSILTVVNHLPKFVISLKSRKFSKSTFRVLRCHTLQISIFHFFPLNYKNLSNINKVCQLDYMNKIIFHNLFIVTI